MAQVFHDQAEYIVKRILLQKSGARDFWARYEWRYRGSAHVGIALWLVNPTDITKTDAELAEIAHYLHSLVSTFKASA